MRIKRPCPISCIRPRVCLRDLTITIYMLPSSSKLSSSSSPPPSSSSPSSFVLSSFLQSDGFTHPNASLLFYVPINHIFYCSISCIRPRLFLVLQPSPSPVVIIIIIIIVIIIIIIIMITTTIHLFFTPPVDSSF